MKSGLRRKTSDVSGWGHCEGQRLENILRWKDPRGEILPIHWTCALEIPSSLRLAFVFTLFFKIKTENPSLLLCILICRFTNQSPVKHVFVVCVCGGGGEGGGAFACVCVCMCDNMSVSLYFCKHSELL